MKIYRLLEAICAQLLLAVAVNAQTSAEPFKLIDPTTSIPLSAYSAGEVETKGGFVFGLALPEKLDKNDYIGYIVGAKTGYAGISHTTGMVRTLLLVVWPDGDTIRTSFRYALDYIAPVLYRGDAKLTQLAHTFNATHFTLTYRCENCFSWEYQGVKGNQSISGDSLQLGWVRGPMPKPVSSQNAIIEYHEEGFGVIPLTPKLAAIPRYEALAAGGGGKKGAAATSSSTPKAGKQPPPLPPKAGKQPPPLKQPTPTALPGLLPLSPLPPLKSGFPKVPGPKVPVPVAPVGPKI